MVSRPYVVTALRVAGKCKAHSPGKFRELDAINVTVAFVSHRAEDSGSPAANSVRFDSSSIQLPADVACCLPQRRRQIQMSALEQTTNDVDG